MEIRSRIFVVKNSLGSLSKCCEKYEQHIDVPYVLHSRDVKVENGITYLPLYMTPCL